MRKEDLDAIKVRADKYLKPKSPAYSDIMNLCETVLQLKKENSLLRQNLFELEQEVPEEQQWHNVISNKLERAGFASGQKDFFEINNSINNVTYTISVQKKFGKTPVQLLKQSEIRRLKAAQKILNLHKELSNLKDACARLRSEVSVLEKIGSPTLDEDLISREKLNVTISILEKVIAKYNNTFHRREITKLHTSMKELLHESMSRTSQLSYEVSRLTSENTKLRGAFLAKKYPICRIYKKRRMGRRRLALH